MGVKTGFDKAKLNAVFAKRRFSDQSKEIAVRVLIDRVDISTLVEETGLGRQRIHNIVKDVKSAYLEQAMYPSNWIMEEVVAPKEMLQKFKAQVELERMKWIDSKPTKKS